jgi:hypothetical protein
LYRQWYTGTALADLLGTDAELAEIHKLYGCHDRLVARKDALFQHIRQRWQDLFNVSLDVLLCYLTSAYFEASRPFPEGDKRRFGYSRDDHRPECVQVVIAPVVTPDGLPIACEVLASNTNDSRTLLHRVSVWQSPLDLADGPRHPDRSGAGGDARVRSSCAISGWHAKGPADETATTSSAIALATGPARRAGDRRERTDSDSIPKPERAFYLLIDTLTLKLPAQPPPRITAGQVQPPAPM